jgi:nucleotide-binding universal stress UspA family protein
MSFLPRRRIVAPVDFSDFSMEAVEVAIDIAGGSQNVHVVHVLPPIEPVEADMILGPVDNEIRIRKATEALKPKFSEPRFANLCVEVLIGDPGHEVTQYAGKIGADLIVIPSHGRTGIKRLLIGSVAERVVRLSHCPVLVLRK